jgi:DNA modification methylase
VKKNFARTFGQDLMRGENVKYQQQRSKNRGGMCDRLAPKKNMKNNKEQSEPSRGFGNSETVPKGEYAYPTEALTQSGTSIFDPVLCELVYRWFCPQNGTILDPFAGGSVRGIVANYLGYHYTGIELRKEQVEANTPQGQNLCPNNPPAWINGDSRNINILTKNKQFDLVFSCPPYGDLEVYSDLENDLSTLPYKEFIQDYRVIIANCIKQLKDDRFACFVVGDFRDKKGFYNNFVADTITAFHDGGMTLYNEGILVTSVGSLPIRVTKQFQSGRKLGKTHQNVLVFYKGDPKNIKDVFGDVYIDDSLFVDDSVANKYGEVL